MSEMTHNIHEMIKAQLNQNDLEVVGIVPIPSHGDRMVRRQTFQELIDEFDESGDQGTFKYLIQIKSKQKPPEATPPPEAPENIYLADGKLNHSYLLKNGDLLFSAGEYALARNIYKSILRSDEYPGVALHRLAKCFEAEGKFDEACFHYEESITYHPHLNSYQRLASLLIRLKQDQKAADVLTRALNLKDLNPGTRFELHKSCGNCLTRAKNAVDAETHFKKALEIQPSADEIRSNLGTLYLQNNQIGEAKRNFQDAIASNPKNYHALSGLGSCRLAEGDKKGAYDFFLESLQIELKNPSALFYLVKCAYEIKNYATAARILAEYIQICPVNANILYSLAGLQFHLGRIQDAKENSLKILELQPKHVGAKDLLELIGRYTGSSR